ncbi:MAG TPA: 4-Cys prefix domain-containing protein, partial [Streptosporangiaceae bacterium]
MASCRQGHPVSAESEFCEICGDDVRPRCSQGHRSVGARFCETCGEPLLAGQDHAADEDPVTLVLDYRSGPFTDFIARDEPDPAGAAAA